MTRHRAGLAAATLFLVGGCATVPEQRQTDALARRGAVAPTGSIIPTAAATDAANVSRLPPTYLGPLGPLPAS